MKLRDVLAWVLETPSRLGPLNLNPATALVGLLVAFLGILISILALSHRQRLIESNIPLYQWDTGVAGSAKKRWMWDSLRLLREGYSKVSDSLSCNVRCIQIPQNW